MLILLNTARFLNSTRAPTKQSPVFNTRQNCKEEDNSDKPQTKRPKVAATTGTFAATFYCFLLGKLASTTEDDILVWQPKEDLHKVLGATTTTAGGVFDTQQTVGRQQWDNGLMSTLSMIYQHVPIHTTIIT